MSPGTIALLGPQRSPTVGRVAQSLGITGTVATITAGWQERESDDAELTEILGGATRNLKLYERWAHVQRHDPEFAAAVRRRRDVLHELRDTYLVRIAHARAAVDALAPEGIDAVTRAEQADAYDGLGGVPAERDNDPSAFPDRPAARAAERAYARDGAIADLQRLDTEHLARLDELNAAFIERWRPHERDVVAAHRDVLASILNSADALAIAGGHVAVLLATAHMFTLHVPTDRPVIAWSAGAMLLTERVVLFHDRTPVGPSDPEVYGRGLAVVPSVIALPHARRRLLVGDRDRMAMLARRFAPDHGLLLDDGARIDVPPGGSLPEGAPVLAADGSVTGNGHTNGDAS